MSSFDNAFIDFMSTKKKKYYFFISMLCGIFKIFFIKLRHYTRKGRYADLTPLYVNIYCFRSD